MIACVLVVPWRYLGPIRGIPVYWQLIDCSFGVFGLMVLAIVHRMIRGITQRMGWRERITVGNTGWHWP